MTTFKKGDKFIPRKPKVNKRNPKWVDGMDEYDGKTLIVQCVSPYNGIINAEDCKYIFHPEWCEKVGDSEIPNNHIPEVRKTIRSTNTEKDCPKILTIDLSPINWEQRRYELAKSAMQGLIVTGWNIYEAPNLVGKSIEIADEMIKQLKGE